jgi:hypothetical protein
MCYAVVTNDNQSVCVGIGHVPMGSISSEGVLAVERRFHRGYDWLYGMGRPVRCQGPAPRVPCYSIIYPCLWPAQRGRSFLHGINPLVLIASYLLLYLLSLSLSLSLTLSVCVCVCVCVCCVGRGCRILARLYRFARLVLQLWLSRFGLCSFAGIHGKGEDTYKA